MAFVVAPDSVLDALREKSERLNRAADEATEKIRLVERALSEARVCVSAMVRVDDCYVGYQKIGDFWRLAYVSDDGKWIPAVYAPRGKRLKVARSIGNIIEAIQKSLDAELENV